MKTFIVTLKQTIKAETEAEAVCKFINDIKKKLEIDYIIVEDKDD